MKRSQKIQLVLITAALASCNRTVIPSRSDMSYAPDSTLTQAPDDPDIGYSCYCSMDDDSTGNSRLYTSYGTGYYSGFDLNVYLPGRIYRRGAFWRNHQFVMRGGFGKSSISAGS